jgi:cellulose biosynthesis protein BcsQ
MADVAAVIVFALLKGGVGKTTSAVGTSLALGRASNLGPVLLVDGDPQATATTTRAALAHRLNQDLEQAITRRGRLAPEDVASLATFENVYPFSHTQIRYTTGRPIERSDIELQLTGFSEGRYQPIELSRPAWAGQAPPAQRPQQPRIMVIDTSPAFVDILAGVLDFVAKQPRALIIVPSPMDDYDLGQARQFPQLLSNSPAAHVPYAILGTKIDGRRKTHRGRVTTLRAAGYRVFDTVIPYGAPFERGPMWDFANPKSPFCRIYKAVAAEALRMAAEPRTEHAGVGE